MAEAFDLGGGGPAGSGWSGYSGYSGPSGLSGSSAWSGAAGGDSGKIYYLDIATSSDLVGGAYKVAADSPSVNPQSTTITENYGTSETLISVFASNPGSPGATSLPAGTAYRHIHAKVDVGEARYKLELFKRDSIGTETPLRTGYSPSFSNTSIQEVIWVFSDSNSFSMDITDRVLFKLYVAKVSGPDPVTVTTYFNGTDNTGYIQTTISSGAAGMSGFSGVSSASGLSGWSGTSAWSGVSAWSGTSGQSGWSGTSAWSGVSGFSSTASTSGWSGFSGGGGSGTGTNLDISVVAGENLAIRDCVYIAGVYNTGTPGRAYKADSSDSLTSTYAIVVGFATGAITAGDSGNMRISGTLGGLTLTAGLYYYASTTGTITSSYPSNTKLVGLAISATELLLNVQTNFPIQGNNGWIFGGYSNSVCSNMDKITCSSSTTAAQTTANLSQVRYGLAGVASRVKGYINGGNSAIDTFVDTSDKITFSTEVTAVTATAKLSTVRAFLSGVTEGLTKGYFQGGSSTAGTNAVATSDKVTYSTDTTAASTTSNLSAASYYTTGMNGGVSKGYNAGGTTGVVIQTRADKITFSTDASAACTTADLSTAKSSLSGVSDGGTKGIWTSLTWADKLTFSTDVGAAATSSVLRTSRGQHASASAGNSNGYFCGGYTGASIYVGNTDNLNFKTEACSASASAALSVARRILAGFGDVGW